MKSYLLISLIIIGTSLNSFGQSKVMKNLSEDYEEATILVFYYSTLKMFIPEENKDLRDLIYNVEKIKVLMVDSLTDEKQKISKIKSDLESEGFEEAMSIRHDESNIIVYIKEKKGITSGFFFLMEDGPGLTAIDLVGEVPMSKLSVLTDHLDLLKDPRNKLLN